MPAIPDISLVFRSGWGPAVAAGIVVAATVAAHFWNRPTRIAVPRKIWRRLALLQFAAALLIALWLVNPRLRHSRANRDEAGLGIVIDATRSMEAKDMPQGDTRYDAARALLAAPDSELRATLAQKARIETYAFDASLKASDPGKLPAAPAPASLSTDLTRTLAAIKEEAAHKNLRGVVLATDGRDTAGGNWRLAAKALGVPVYAVGFGARRGAGWRNAGVDAVDAPTRGGMGQEVEVRAKIAQEGCAGAAVTVRLEENGKALASTTLSLNGDPVQEASLKFKPDSVDVHLYDVVIDPPGGDALREDDRQSFTMLVTDRVLRVFYAEGRLRWVYKFLRRALENEKTVALDSVVATGPGRLMQQGPSKLALRNLLPDEASLDGYDVVVLGDLTPQLLPPDDAAALERFVREKKGGLLVIGGDGLLKTANWNGTPLAAMLPAAIDPSAAPWSPEASSAPRITAAGNRAGALAGLDPFLNSLSMRNVFPLGAAKPGAEVWLEAGAQNPRPLMTAQRYGEGRTLLLSSDDFWEPNLWQTGDGEKSLPARFWIQAIHWCAGMNDTGADDDPLVMASSDKSHYAPGETVALTALVRKAPSGDAAAAPFAAQGVVSLVPPGGAAPVELERFDTGQPDADNTLRRNWLPPGDGAYAVKYKATRGAESAESECRFTVGRPAEELAQRGVDEDALRTLARLTEGAYYDSLDARRIAEDFERSQTAGRAVVETELVDSPWLFALFILVVAAGWTIRRRNNLI